MIAEELLSRKLVFQSIGLIRERFAALGLDPFSQASSADLDFLTLNIQKRHVVGHNLAIADEHYAQFAKTEQTGETVTLLGEEINRFADCCLNVVTVLDTWLLPNVQLPALETCQRQEAHAQGGSARISNLGA